MADKDLSKDEIEELRKLIRLLKKDISDLDFDNLIKSGNAARDYLKQLREETEDLTSDISDAAEGFKNIVYEIRRANSTANDAARSFNKLSSIAEQIKYHQSDISKLSLKEINSLKVKATIEKDKLKSLQDILLKRKLELQSHIQELNIKKLSQGLTDDENKKLNVLNQRYKKNEIALENTNRLVLGQNNSFEKLILTLEDIEEKLKNRLKIERELLGLSGAIVEGLVGSLNKIGLKKLADQLGLDEAKDKMKEVSDKIIRDREKETTLVKNIKNTSNDISKVADQLVFKEEELIKAKQKLENLKKSGANIKDIQQSEELVNSLRTQVEITKDRKKELKDILEKEKEELKIISATNAQFTGIGGKLATLKAGLSSMGSSLIKNLKDPLVLAGLAASALTTIFKKFFDLGLKSDTEVTNLAKSMGVSYNEASLLRNRFVEIERGTVSFSSNLDASLKTTKNLVEAQFQLAEAFGATRGFTDQQLGDQIQLTKQMGFAADEAAGLQQLMLANSMTADQVIDTTIKQTTALVKQKGIQLDNKKILGEVAKVSGQLRLQYKNNPELIAQAVIQTRKLGVSLQQAADASKGLLDFETSINDELSAELLTGRDINLERARLLRLNGDVAGAMEEIFSQLPKINEFMNMNTIQQEATAKLAGMTADEYADALVQQQNLKNLGTELKKQVQDRANELRKQGRVEEANQLMREIGSEKEAKDSLKRLDIQSRINNYVERLQSILVNIVSGPMGNLLRDLETFLSDSKNINEIVEVVKLFVAGLAEGFKVVKGIADVFKFIAGLIPDGMGKFIAGAAGVVAVGGLAAAVGKLALQGLTPLTASWVRVVGGMPGSPGAGGGKGAGGMVAALGRIAGVFAILKTLTNAYTNLTEKDEATGEKKRSTSNALLKTADQNKFAAAGAGLGAAIGAFGFGVGAVPGAGIGAGIGMAMDYAFGEDTQMVDDFIFRPGQKPIKFRKDDIILGGTSIDKDLKPKTSGGDMNREISSLKGAGLGAIIGTMILPGLGTIIGAGLGGVVGAVYKTLDNSSKLNKVQQENINKVQQENINKNTQVISESSKLNKVQQEDINKSIKTVIESSKLNKVQQENINKNIEITTKSSKIQQENIIKSIGSTESSKLNKVQQENIINNKEKTLVANNINTTDKIQQEFITEKTKKDKTESNILGFSLDSLIKGLNNFSDKILNKILTLNQTKFLKPVLEETNLTKESTKEIQPVPIIIQESVPSKLDIPSINNKFENNINDKLEKAINKLEISFVNAVNNLNNRPIEVHTTAEIDGEMAGRTISKYTTTNGTTTNIFSYKTQ